MARPIIAISLTLAAFATAAGQTDDRSHLVNFTNKYSQWGRLDWKADRLTYIGDMPIEQAGNAFFNSLYAGLPAATGPLFQQGRRIASIHREANGSVRLLSIVFLRKSILKSAFFAASSSVSLAAIRASRTAFPKSSAAFLATLVFFRGCAIRMTPDLFHWRQTFWRGRTRPASSRSGRLP